MRAFALIAAGLLLASCTTMQDTPPRDVETKTYPQDYEQCSAQPEVVWCVQACIVDDNAYEWCSNDGDEN